MTYIVYANSTQRDSVLYPYGNSYTLHLTKPIKNISRVDLVSAIVPNTVYNLTAGTNVIYINDTSNVSLNPGFYTASTLVSEFNDSRQVTSGTATLAYLANEGHFIFYGSLTSITCNSEEIANILGLPLGKTNALTVASNPVYANNVTYSTVTNYVKSVNIVNLNLNEYIWLDIQEFRTPTTIDARKLISSSNTKTTQSNTAATSFALIPMDVQNGSIKSFKEHSDYYLSIYFPSRLDSLERLSVRWLDRNGQPLVFNGLDTNSFTLRIHTVIPQDMERPVSLPEPVREERTKIFMGAVLALIIGLIVILMSKRR